MNKAKTTLLTGFLAGILAITVSLSGCSKEGVSSVAGGGQKVATVNGTTITKSDYDKTYGEFEKAFHLEMMPKDQQVKLTDTLQQMTLNKLILQTLIRNEAQKDGIQVTEADIQNYKQEKIFKNPMLKEQFKSFLEQNKMQESDFDNMLKDNLLLTKLMEARGGDSVKITDSDVKMFYTKNIDQFKIPERIHASHVLVKAIVPQLKQELRAKNPKITDAELDKEIAQEKSEKKAKADKLFSEVKADPTKYPEIAKNNSEDPVSAKQNGDLGYMVESNIDPSFWAAAKKTPNNQFYPGVVESQFGYHIIKVLDRQAPHQQTFDEAKEMIREHLSQEKKQVFLQKWAEQQKATAKIDIEAAYKPKAPEAAPPGMMGAQQVAAPQQQAVMPAQPQGKTQ